MYCEEVFQWLIRWTYNISYQWSLDNPKLLFFYLTKENVFFGNHLAFFCQSLTFTHFNFHLKVTSSNQRHETWNVGIHTSTNKVSHGRGQYGPRIEKLSYLKLKKNP